MHEIFCEGTGFGASRSLTVTTNCYNALKSLRLPEEMRALWIDTICINQKDVEERGAQVAIMRSIYSGAFQVVVYLGESEDGSNSVMRYVQDRYAPLDYPKQETIIPKPSEEARQNFSSRAWFIRTWVLQELFSAQKVEVRCGRISVLWEALEDYYKHWGSRADRDNLRIPAAHEVMKFISWTRRRSGKEVVPGINSTVYSLCLVFTETCPSSGPIIVALQTSYSPM